MALDILHAYVDASGKYETASDRILTINGCLSTPDRWAALSDEWCDYLKEHKFKRDPRTGRFVFHTSPFWAGACSLMPDKLALADKYRIYHDLVTIIRKYTVFRFGFGVLLDDFRKVEAEIPHVRKAILKEPGTRMSILCFQGNSAWAQQNNYDASIAYTFDRGDEFFKELYAGYCKVAALDKTPDQVETVRHLIPENKAICTPIQAADVLAWECRRNALHWQFAKRILPVNKSQLVGDMEWPPSRELRRLNQPGKSDLRFYDESHLRDEVREIIAKAIPEEKRESFIGDGKPFKDLEDFIRGLCFFHNEIAKDEKAARGLEAETNRQKKLRKKGV